MFILLPVRVGTDVVDRRVNFDLVKHYEPNGEGGTVIYYKSSGHDTVQLSASVIDRALGAVTHTQWEREGNDDA